jgi:hypothetical protein
MAMNDSFTATIRRGFIVRLILAILAMTIVHFVLWDFASRSSNEIIHIAGLLLLTLGLLLVACTVPLVLAYIHPGLLGSIVMSSEGLHISWLIGHTFVPWSEISGASVQLPQRLLEERVAILRTNKILSYRLLQMYVFVALIPLRLAVGIMPSILRITIRTRRPSFFQRATKLLFGFDLVLADVYTTPMSTLAEQISGRK